MSDLNPVSEIWRIAAEVRDDHDASTPISTKPTATQQSQPAPVELLTAIQRNVCEMLIEEIPPKEIAHSLGITIDGFNWHTRKIKRLLKCKTLVGVALCYDRHRRRTT